MMQRPGAQTPHNPLWMMMRGSSGEADPLGLRSNNIAAQGFVESISPGWGALAGAVLGPIGTLGVTGANMAIAGNNLNFADRMSKELGGPGLSGGQFLGGMLNPFDRGGMGYNAGWGMVGQTLAPGLSPEMQQRRVYERSLMAAGLRGLDGRGSGGRDFGGSGLSGPGQGAASRGSYDRAMSSKY